MSPAEELAEIKEMLRRIESAILGSLTPEGQYKIGLAQRLSALAESYARHEETHKQGRIAAAIKEGFRLIAASASGFLSGRSW